MEIVQTFGHFATEWISAWSWCRTVDRDIRGQFLAAVGKIKFRLAELTSATSRMQLYGGLA